jgi:hypothetical protein
LTQGIIAALITAGVLGLWFPSTRAIAICAIAALAFMFPWLVVAILIGAAAAFFLFHVKSK